MDTTIGTSLLNNATHICSFTADLVTEDGENVRSRELIASTMLAAAIFCRYSEEDKEAMMRMFSLMLEACDEIPLNDEE